MHNSVCFLYQTGLGAYKPFGGSEGKAHEASDGGPQACGGQIWPASLGPGGPHRESPLRLILFPVDGGESKRQTGGQRVCCNVKLVYRVCVCVWAERGVGAIRSRSSDIQPGRIARSSRCSGANACKR